MFLSAMLTLSMIFGYKWLVQSAVQTETISTSVDLDTPDDEPPEEIELEPSPEWRTYRVQKGDVLGSILPKFGLPTAKIRTAALEIVDLANLRIGQEFRVKMTH